MALDPMVLMALIGAGGSLLQGGVSGIGASGAQRGMEKGQAAQAANLNDLAQLIMNQPQQRGIGMGDTSGLRHHANRQLTAGSKSLDAMLSSRGLYDSSASLGAHSALAGDVLSGLAGAINDDDFRRQSFNKQLGATDQLSRLGMAAQIYQNPVFASPRYDHATNSVRGGK